MAIENRNLEAGSKLAARCKRQTYSAEVIQTDEGIRYQLGSGETSGTTPSGANGKKTTSEWRAERGEA